MCGQALCEDGALWLPTRDHRERAALWLVWGLTLSEVCDS